MRFVALIALGVVVAAFTPEATANTYDLGFPQTGFVLRGKPQVLVQTSTTTARLYDLEGNILRTFELGQRIWSIDVSPDDRLVALRGSGCVRIWKIADATILAERKWVSVSFSPDGAL